MERTACFFGRDSNHWIVQMLLELGEFENWDIDLDTSEPLRVNAEVKLDHPVSSTPK
jgi:hypothetical protein